MVAGRRKIYDSTSVNFLRVNPKQGSIQHEFSNPWRAAQDAFAARVYLCLPMRNSVHLVRVCTMTIVTDLTPLVA